MRITIRENEEATILDQFDEQQIKRLPLDAKIIEFVFYNGGENESDIYETARVDALIYNLIEWGILESEDVEISVDIVDNASDEYKCEINIIV